MANQCASVDRRQACVGQRYGGPKPACRAGVNTHAAAMLKTPRQSCPAALLLLSFLLWTTRSSGVSMPDEQVSTRSRIEATVAGFGPTAVTDYWLGQAFTTDAQSYTLNFITAPLGEQTAGTMRAQLFLGNGAGLPTGAALADFTYDAISAALPATSDVTFTPTATFTLGAGTQYVFVMDPISAGYWGWSATLSSNGYTTPAGNPWTMSTGYAGSLDHTSWSQPNTTLNMRLSVNATAIPEPATYAAVFGAAVLVGTALVHRRRVV